MNRVKDWIMFQRCIELGGSRQIMYKEKVKLLGVEGDLVYKERIFLGKERKGRIFEYWRF